jgi:hypothetical protein
MTRDGRSSSHDPTAEPAARQSAPGAGGFASQHSRGAGRAATDDDQVVNRTTYHTTPRRYDQPVDADEAPRMRQGARPMRREVRRSGSASRS